MRKDLADSPAVDVVAGPPSRLLLTLPTTARPATPARLTVAVVDALGNGGCRVEGKVNFKELPSGLDLPPAITLSAADEGHKTIPFVPREEGVYRLPASGPPATLSASSSPRVVGGGRPGCGCGVPCPRGGLLSGVSRFAWLRREINEDECLACKRCNRACPVSTIDPGRNFASDPAECIMCLECVGCCPASGEVFHWRLSPGPAAAYDPSRRQVLGWLGGANGRMAIRAPWPCRLLV